MVKSVENLSRELGRKKGRLKLWGVKILKRRRKGKLRRIVRGSVCCLKNVLNMSEFETTFL